MIENKPTDSSQEGSFSAEVNPEKSNEPESKIFEKRFSPMDYIETYYPAVDIEKTLWAFEKIKKELAENDGKIDIGTIVEATGLSNEQIENVAIIDFQKKVMEKMLEEFPEDNINVLDVGGGPTIYQHIAISLGAGDITHSEFLEQNREEVLKWLNDENNCHNWDSYFELVKIILQNDEKYQNTLQNLLASQDEKVLSHAKLIKNLIDSPELDNFKKHLKERIKDRVVHGDVFRKNLGMTQEGNFELVNSSGRESAVELLTSNFSIESATGDRAKWEQGMKNIMAMVKDKGFLALTAIRNAESYNSGGEIMPAVNVNEKHLEEIFRLNGFEVLNTTVLYGGDKEKNGYDGMVLILAQKM